MAHPRSPFSRARAHWLARDLLAWEKPGGRFALHVSAGAGLTLAADGVAGGEAIPLHPDQGGLPWGLRLRFPHLQHLAVLRLPQERLGDVPELLRGQLAVSAADSAGRFIEATGVQIPGVLDDVFHEPGPLGVVFARGRPWLRLWAPTARAVNVHLYPSPRSTARQVVKMTLAGQRGTWSVEGDRDWLGKYYQYEVEVHVPATGRIERHLVTDPYSISLSANGRRSQVVDLGEPALRPEGWDALVKPPLEAPEEIALYELHVRDFSASDPDVPEPLRGTYKAFALPKSRGLDHLAALAQSGLTHVHLLPCFDVASIEEDRSRWLVPEGDLAAYPPDSEQQQAAVAAVAHRDGFNWGYDPHHYLAPEGSYATDPDGPTRIREFREMVQGLNRRGLRVVMDVVFNHTAASGQAAHSVLDRIVPGYYHRLDGDGKVEASTCCANTASEHAMMGRLIVDAVLLWARHYQVDGFRFDLMGHHMKRNLLAVRHALDALTLKRDGVDGRAVYVYGEAWDFGEVAGNARGVNASQSNLAGTGIGTFNDRLRDAVRGGGAFGPLHEQGFGTGVLDTPNEAEPIEEGERRRRMLVKGDRVRIGLAGGVSEFRFVDASGRLVRADEVDHWGKPAGYAADPQEMVNYVEAHDNETFFDAIQLKAPRSLPMAERVRMHNFALSLVALAQGIPFFHAGQELLRSKSLDRNSYDSGDWFNRLDFTYQTNNWGVGLAPARDNQANWAIHRPLLADPALKPGPEHIRRALAHFHELLRIRRSSRLFRLRSAAEVCAHLRFLDGGPDQIPGLIVVALEDTGGRVDPGHPLIVVLFNARASATEFLAPETAGRNLVRHPVQHASDDALLQEAGFDAGSGRFRVPERTTAVFWEAC